MGGMKEIPALIQLAVLSAPFWIPIVFAAFWIGRKQFSIGQLFILITVEAISLGCALAMLAASFALKQG